MVKIALLCSLLVVCGCFDQRDAFIAKPAKKVLTTCKDIRLDGGYLGVYDSPASSLSNKEMGCFFFYGNGVALWYTPIAYKEDSVILKEWVKKKIEDRINFEQSFFKDKVGGGITCNSSILTIQVYVYSKYKWHLSTLSGNIINDSTIFINKCDVNEASGLCRENFYLRFIKMQKPDSTNRLMKKSWYWR